jgi:hypothetical protein
MVVFENKVDVLLVMECLVQAGQEIAHFGFHQDIFLIYHFLYQTILGNIDLLYTSDVVNFSICSA